MTRRLVEAFRGSHDLTVNFANTGQEHPATLEFVDRCDREFGFNVIWLEALVDPEEGVGIRHTVVNYETASRNGKPFRDYIAKYGIPNMGSPQCTTKLKEHVMNSYRHNALGWVGGRHPDYETAIGIRADETHRVDKRAAEKRFIYPLVEAGITKDDVVREVRSWGFDLKLPGEHYGNCVWCWKKSNRKLLTLAKDTPQIFDFPAAMEREFGDFKCNPAVTSPNGKRQFFRGHRSTLDILELARTTDFERFYEKYEGNVFDPALDIGSGCGMESCEVGASDEPEEPTPPAVSGECLPVAKG